MFTLNATDARQLQKIGIPAEEYMNNAVDKCQSAIIDTARKGSGQIGVAVFRLTDEQLEELEAFVKEAGFEVTEIRRGNATTNLINIKWGE